MHKKTTNFIVALLLFMTATVSYAQNESEIPDKPEQSFIETYFLLPLVKGGEMVAKPMVQGGKMAAGPITKAGEWIAKPMAKGGEAFVNVINPKPKDIVVETPLQAKQLAVNQKAGGAKVVAK